MTGWSEFYGKSDFPPNGLNKHADFTFSNGKVVQVLVYRENELEYKTVYSYDGRGNKTKEVTIAVEDGNTTNRTFKYDQFNRTIEYTYEYTYSTGANSSKIESEYDAADNIVKETHYDKDRLLVTYVRTFDGKKPIKMIVVEPDGTVTSTLKNTYNPAGNLILTAIDNETVTSKTAIDGKEPLKITGTGSVKSTTANTYDPPGNLILTTIDDESITSKTTIEYYENGKMSSRDRITVAKENGKPQHSEAQPRPGRDLEKYDKQGHQIERYIYDAAGNLYLTLLSTWDALGKQTRLIETSRTHQYDRDIAYEYDSHGNEIKSSCRKSSATGEVQFLLAARKLITYYE